MTQRNVISEAKAGNLPIRHLICVFLACLFTVGVCIYMWHCAGIEVPSEAYEDRKIPQNSISVWADAEKITYNSTLYKDGSITADKNDAQLYVRFDDKNGYPLHGVVLQLGTPFFYDFNCILYYPNEIGEYSEDRKLQFTLPEGETTVYFSLPESTDWLISELRFDIDADYSVVDVRITEDRIADSYFPWKHLSLSALFIYFILILLLLEGAVFAVKRFSGRGFCSSKRLKVHEKLHFVQKSKTDKAVLVLFSTALFCVFIAFEFHEYARKTSYPHGMFTYVYILAATAAVITGICFLLCDEKNEWNCLRYYTAFFFIAAIAYMLVFLPFISPDETEHYRSAYRVSNVILGNLGQIGDNRILLRLEDFNFFTEGKRSMTPDYYLCLRGSFQLFAGSGEYRIMDAPMVSNALFSYLTAGLGIAIARILHLGALLTFYAGRLANVILFTATFHYALKKIPAARCGLFVFAMTPMTLSVVGSYSYDGPTLVFIMLFTVQVMSLMVPGESAAPREIIKCTLYGILMAPSKLVFAPLLFLVLLIPNKNLGENTAQALKKKVCILLAGIFSVLVITGAVNLMSSNGAIREMINDDSTIHMVKWAHEEGYTISWVLGHPLRFIAIFTRTIVLMTDNYFFTMIGTQFGWLDIPAPQINAVICFVTMLLALNVRTAADREPKIGIAGKLFVAILCAGSMFAVLLAMFLDWTPLSYNYIVGVQGRYILPLLLPCFLILRNNMICVGEKMQKTVISIMSLLNIWILIYCFTECMCA